MSQTKNNRTVYDAVSWSVDWSVNWSVNQSVSRFVVP